MRKEVYGKEMVFLAMGIGFPLLIGITYTILYAFNIYKIVSYEPVVILGSILISIYLGIHIFKLATRKNWNLSKGVLCFIITLLPMIVGIWISIFIIM